MGESHENYQESSIWPILLAIGITLMAIGVVTNLIISGLGVIILLFSLGGWTQENRVLAQQFPSEEMDEEND
jgi:hypothetical protein